LINQRGKFLASLGNLQLAAQCFECDVLAYKHRGNSYMVCRGLQNLCLTYVMRGRLTQALIVAEEACFLAEGLGTAVEIELHDAFACRGIAHGLRGNISVALNDFERANVADLSNRDERDVLHGQKMVNFSRLLIRLGQLDRAEAILKQMQVLYTQDNWLPDARRCDLALAQVAFSKGARREALSLIEQAITWGVKTTDQEILVWAYLILARLFIDEHKLEEAIRVSYNGLQMAEECGYGVHWIDLQVTQGEAYLQLGRPDLANKRAGLALEGLQQFSGYPEMYGASSPESQYRWGKGDALHLLGLALLEQGHSDEAHNALIQALAIRRDIRDPKGDQSQTLLRETGRSDLA
jgi:tetratricopeptide (TPR) repeat protein